MNRRHEVEMWKDRSSVEWEGRNGGYDEYVVQMDKIFKE